MGAPRSMAKLDRLVRVNLNDTLTSGVTKSDPSKPICQIRDFYVDNRVATLYLEVNDLLVNIPGDAALAFGEHLFSYPSGMGRIQPMWTTLAITGSCPSGLSATAGEIGAGSTIASGASAVLTGTAGFHNIMEAQTIANHVAATPLAIAEEGPPDAVFAGGQTAPVEILDASSADVKFHLNIASTWDQTAAENYTFGGTLVHQFRVLASSAGVI